MKSTILLFLFPLFSIDVFGADVKEPVSVMVGDSVTLHTDTNIQTADVIEWSFGQKPIAMIDEGSIIITAFDENLKGRLQLVRQTGDLKIINIKTTDSGDYKLDLTRASRTEESVTMTFRVRVVSADEVKSVSVMEGDSVTLHTDPTYLQRDSVKKWRSDHQISPIAEINRKAGNFNTSDGRFRDRIHLDYQTGSLTIKNMRTTDSGLYEADIISTSSKHTIHHTQSFSVTVKDAVKSVSVKEGETIPLKTDVTEIQKDDQILWVFEDTVLAEINKAAQRFYISDGANERFRDRLKLDNHTGSLIIRDTRTTDSGLYELKICSSRHTINRRFIVTVSGLHPAVIPSVICSIVFVVLVIVVAAVIVKTYHHNNSKLKTLLVRTYSVMKGKPFTLYNNTKIQKNDHIQWKYEDEDSPIAEMNRGEDIFSTYDGPGGKFINRLNLDQTGSLTITNIETTDSGRYKLEIMSDDNPSLQLFTVTVCDEMKKVKLEETVTLNPVELKKDDEIQWLFENEDSPIVQFKLGTGETPRYCNNERFEDTLQLNQTGSLTIKKIRSKHSGVYELKIMRGGETLSKRFIVTVFGATEKKMRGGQRSQPSSIL